MTNEIRPHKPRVYQFAHQEKEINRLQKEIERLQKENEKLELIAEEKVQLRYEQSEQRLAAETEANALREQLAIVSDSHANCTEWYHSMWAERDALQAELDAIRKAMRGYADSDLVSLSETLSASDKAHGKLREWSQSAYTRLSSLMTIGVSMTPDAVTAQLLQDAPESVKGGVK